MKIGLQGAITLALVGAAVGTAEAGPIYSFNRITNNSPYNPERQLTVEVNAAGPNQVDFTFRNSGPFWCGISDIFFDDGTLLGISQIIDSGLLVSFHRGASPGNLPGGATLDFQTTQGFSADSDWPDQIFAIHPGEWLTIRFNLINGQTYEDTLDAIELGLAQGGVEGSLRIGLQVRSGLLGLVCDSFVNGGQIRAIPLPTAAAMSAVGLGLVARRRRRV